MKRTLVIGDIHGGLKALKQVLDRANFNNEEDRLVILGDYVDGWSQSSEVIEFLINLKKENKEHIFIEGNHDYWVKDWLLYGYKNEIWIQQGGKATVESYIKTGLLTSQEHKLFFRGLYRYFIDEENNLYVHGGFRGKFGSPDNIPADYMWDRSLIQDAMSSKDCGKMRGQEFNNIFIGHTSTVGFSIKPHYPEYKDKNQPKNGGILIPIKRCNIINLDTGGGWYGKLTIMDRDTKEYWQSDFVKDLYPEEKGR